MPESIPLQNARSILEQELLEVVELSEYDEIDAEIRQWLSDQVSHEHVQRLSSFQITSQSEAQAVARAIAATCNGAVRQRSEFGYLLLDVRGVKVRLNLSDRSSSYLQFGKGQQSLEKLETAIQMIASDFLRPCPKIYASRQPLTVAGDQYIYLRIHPTNGLLTFFNQDSQHNMEGWDLF